MNLNSMNSKMLFLPLKELQHYLSTLELENEKLKQELTIFSRFNCILENIRRSSGKGFTALQCIDRNKSCRCNEHMNGHLRRVAHEADIEQRVWQEQYDKLVLKSKQEYYSHLEEDNSSPYSSRRSNTGSTVEETHVESETEMSLGSVNYQRCDSLNCSDSGFSSSHLSNDSNDKFAKNIDEKSANNDEAVIRYITLSPSNTETPSPPLVVFDSKSNDKLVCDWPNCNQVFINEEILMHHRRNHIRKSIYHCQYCSTRLLSKEDLENHLKKHRISNGDEDIEVDVVDDRTEQSCDAQMMAKAQSVNITKGSNFKLNDKQFTFQSSLFDKYNHHKSLTTTNTDSTLEASKPPNKPEEYKKTRYSGVGRYRCPWPDCGYTPHFLRDLRRHMYKHTGDKKHKCDFPGCDFVSVWKTSLLQHQRKKHFFNNTNNHNNIPKSPTVVTNNALIK